MIDVEEFRRDLAKAVVKQLKKLPPGYEQFEALCELQDYTSIFNTYTSDQVVKELET